MLKRFTAERTLQQRQETSLANELATKYSLTHKGRSLEEYGSEFSDYSGAEDPEEAARSGTIDKATVSHTHFGGFSDSTVAAPDAVRKTKAEVMREVIAKSKAYKMERQRVKEENEDLREQLNEDFDELRGMLFAEEKDQCVHEEEPSALAEYDSLVRELAFDKRGKPTDRLKSEAEVALLERERLEQLERDRISRMQAVEGVESEEESDEESEGEESGDENESEGEESDEENESEGESESELDDQESEGETQSEVEQEIEDDHSPDPSLNQCSNSIPFVIPIPATYKELTSLCHRPFPEVLAVVQRILTFHSPLAHPQTKPQMAIFHPILLKFLFDRFSTWENTDNLNAFANLVIANCKFFPMETTLFLRGTIFKLASAKPLSCSNALLFGCKFVLSLLSCSDFYNVVVTPTYILLATLFERGGRTEEELPQLLFLAELFLQSQQVHSKRIMPELFGFLVRVSKAELCREGEAVAFGSLVYGGVSGDGTIGVVNADSCRKFNTFDAFHAVLQRLCLTYQENVAFLEIVEPFAGEPVFAEAIAKAKMQRGAFPLQLHKEKAREITTLEPDYAVDSREAKAKLSQEQLDELESKKLRWQVKQEKKSLIKEIRKDSAFIATYKHKKLIQADKEYRQKMNSIIGQVSNEASASKNPNPAGKKQKLSKF